MRFIHVYKKNNTHIRIAMNQTGSICLNIYIYRVNGVSYVVFGLGEAAKGNFPTHWALRVSNSFMCSEV